VTIAKLPSGRYRVRVWHNGRDVAAAPILGLPDGYSWERKRGAGGALEAEAKAREILRGNAAQAVTVADFHRRWTTDPLFLRPKQSTNIHNEERTRAFVARYGSLLMRQVSDQIVAEWVAGGQRNSTVPALRAMFNDAASAKAGRLVLINPFADLGIRKTKGNKAKRPPSLEQMENMVLTARQITPPSFAAYLEFACLTAGRPSELDALRWAAVRFDDGEVDLVEQWNAKVRDFTEPKYGPYTVALVDRARRLLQGMKRAAGAGEFVFSTDRGTHYTPSARHHHWDRVRCSIGTPDLTLYLASRHFFASYSLNVLDLPPHVIAEQLGHKDGGKLIVQLYGHPDAKIARRQIRDAWDTAATVRHLRSVKDDLA
jgi:integrase